MQCRMAAEESFVLLPPLCNLQHVSRQARQGTQIFSLEPACDPAPEGRAPQPLGPGPDTAAEESLPHVPQNATPQLCPSGSLSSSRTAALPFSSFTGETRARPSAPAAALGCEHRASIAPSLPVLTIQESHRFDPADYAFLGQVKANMDSLAKGRRPVVLLATGAFNPVHRQHTRMFYLARRVSACCLCMSCPAKACSTWNGATVSDSED